MHRCYQEAALIWVFTRTEPAPQIVSLWYTVLPPPPCTPCVKDAFTQHPLCVCVCRGGGLSTDHFGRYQIAAPFQAQMRKVAAIIWGLLAWLARREQA